MLALFLMVDAAGVSQAGPQPAPPIPNRRAAPPIPNRRAAPPIPNRRAAPPVPARQPLPSTVQRNPTNQAAAEPAPAKIIHIYRGEGYFDNALAEKLRSVLTGKSQPATSQGSPAPKFTLRQ